MTYSIYHPNVLSIAYPIYKNPSVLLYWSYKFTIIADVGGIESRVSPTNKNSA